MSIAATTERPIETKGESNRLTDVLERQVESSRNVARFRSEEGRQ